MKPAISAATLARELQRILGGELASLAPMAEGEESRAFGFRRGADAFVVRVNPSIDGFRKDAFAHRHFARANLPVPEVVATGLLQDGHAYCVSRRLPGVTLQDLVPAQLPAVLEPVAVVLDAIGGTDIGMTRGFGPLDADGIGSYPTWRDFLTSVGDRRRYDWQGLGSRAGLEGIDRLLDLVASLAGHCPEVRRLVHGDFGSNNVLTDGHAITGVIDWSEALAGDPLYDVANILFWAPWLDCMAQQARYFETCRPDLLRHPERLRCYQLRIGIEEIYQGMRAGDSRLVAWAISRCERIAADAA